MDTSSDSDSFTRARGHKPRGRELHRRAGRDRGRGGGGGGGEGATGDLSEKLSTLAHTLQDTSRNLSKVDRRLGQYRDFTDDQAETMAVLRENLEESISQLRKQRLSRSTGAQGASASASASASTLHSSDLEPCSGSDGQRFFPTSPLRDYTSTPHGRRRSQSVGVRFKESGEDVHVLHQSLRDLRCDHDRLSQDFNREILWRNRSDVDAKRAVESLTGHVTTSQRQASAASSIEQRLQELEREIHAGERGRRRSDQRGGASEEQQETSGRFQAQERDDAITERLLRAEREKLQKDQELDRARRLLQKSEDSRETLAQQVEDMQEELLRSRKEKKELQRSRMESQSDREEARAGSSERLEKEVSELRVQLSRASVFREVEELKKLLEGKETERVQLSLQVQKLSSDLTQREQLQLRMLDQLRDLQSQRQTERKETEELLQESSRSREELRSRAQEAVKQWRAKVRRLQKELEEERAQAQLHTEKVSQAVGEQQSSRAQLKALTQQSEAARRELDQILARLAQREEELHRKDVELSESRQRHLALEQEIRQVKEASAALEEETLRQAAAQAKLREENQRLEERADAHARRCQRERDSQAELQASFSHMTSSHSQLTQRLAEGEHAKKELQKNLSELQAKLKEAQEERAALAQQLQLEREVHQKELEHLRRTVEDGRTKKEREVQEVLKLCQQEREEIQAQLKEVQADAASDKELSRTLRINLSRMKDECDKLTAQLSSEEQTHALLQRQQQVESGERWRSSQSELVKLEEKVLKLEAEREAVLTSLGQELDATCRSLARNGDDKLKAICQKAGLVKDPHHWLAETKTKLRWLCEEVRESSSREQRLRKQQQQTRDQLQHLRRSKDTEQETLTQQLHQQETLLRSVSAEKQELLEKSRRKEEEMRNLQERVLDVEMSTRAALDHLESIPEKPCLMKNFKDLEEFQQQKEAVEQKHNKYREIIWNLQHQLDESKRRIQEYRDEKLDASSRSLRLAALSSSIKDSRGFMSSSMRSDSFSSSPGGKVTPERSAHVP